MFIEFFGPLGVNLTILLPKFRIYHNCMKGWIILKCIFSSHFLTISKHFRQYLNIPPLWQRRVCTGIFTKTISVYKKANTFYSQKIYLKYYLRFLICLNNFIFFICIQYLSIFSWNPKSQKQFGSWWFVCYPSRHKKSRKHSI